MVARTFWLIQEAPDEQALLQEAFGRDAKFLLMEKSDGSGEFTVNESLVNMLVSCRGKYVLCAAHALMESPSKPAKLVHMEDLTHVQVKHLHQLLGYLGSPDDDGYVSEVEGHLALQRRTNPSSSAGAHEEDVEEVAWGSLWCRILTEAVTASSQSSTDSSTLANLSGKEIAKFLPKPAVICPAGFLNQGGKDGKGPGGKDSSAAATATSQADRSSGSGGAVKDSVGQATLAEIYCMHNLGSFVDLNVMNIMALRATVEAHLMSVAVTKSSEKLLKTLRVDSKNAAILRLCDIDNGLKGEKLYVFGSVSTEWSSKSIKVSSRCFFLAWFCVFCWIKGLTSYNALSPLVVLVINSY